MKRFPTLDEIESGHTRETAELDGQLDILDAIDAEALGWAHTLAEEAHGR
jgi:hypothetical protein